jgi:hypothetical protein
MQENMFNPMAVEMRLLFEALHDSGFTEQQAFELTKTYCSVVFVNHALRESQYGRRSKQEITKQMREQLAKYKDKEVKSE